MTIGFCGHSEIVDISAAKNAVFRFLEKIFETDVIFLLGGYGDFDSICLACCEEYKKSINPNAKLCFVTPYLSDSYLKNKSRIAQKCDEIIYPELENVPKRYAISRRNQWIVDHCDVLLCFIDYGWGGAYQMCFYAKRKKACSVINLGTLEIK